VLRDAARVAIAADGHREPVQHRPDLRAGERAVVLDAGVGTASDARSRWSSAAPLSSARARSRAPRIPSHAAAIAGAVAAVSQRAGRTDPAPAVCECLEPACGHADLDDADCRRRVAERWHAAWSGRDRLRSARSARPTPLRDPLTPRPLGGRDARRARGASVARLSVPDGANRRAAPAVVRRAAVRLRAATRAARPPPGKPPRAHRPRDLGASSTLRASDCGVCGLLRRTRCGSRPRPAAAPGAGGAVPSMRSRLRHVRVAPAVSRRRVSR